MFIYSLLKLYLIFDIYQQGHYQIKPYLKHFSLNIVHYNLFPVLCIILSNIGHNHIVIKYLLLICSLLYSLSYFFVKVKLKFSRRIIRVISFSIIYLLSLGLFSFSDYLYLFLEFSIIPILFLESLVSYLLNKKYLKRTKSSLNNYAGKKIIITGSYGKTTTKNLFNQALNIFYNTKATPKSYNTPLGISKFIEDNNISYYDYIVLEYGVSKKKDMKKLISLSKPDISVVTEVGYMHMDGFKRIIDVLNEKMLLAENSKIAILNYDNELIRDYKFKNKNVLVLSYGLDYGLYQARNLRENEFDFYYKNEFVITINHQFKISHQILNMLAPLAYLHYIGCDLSKVNNVIKSFKLESNRFEIKGNNNHLIFDDSFNSNLVGFKNSLNAIKEFKRHKILITPGIVELGKYKNKINKELAFSISGCVDEVIVVGNHEVDDLFYCLKKYKIKIYRCQSFKEGYKLYLSIIKNLKESILLIENDLPDIYKRRFVF